MPFEPRDPGVLAVPFADGDPGVQVREQAQVPGIGEIVLISRAHEARLLFPVDIEVIVGFAEPAADGAVQADDAADILAVALHFQERVIGERLDRPFLVVAGMKIHRLRGERVQLDPIDVEVAGSRPPRSLIGHGQAGLFVEGHLPVGVEGPAVGGDLDGQGADDGPHAVAGGEKIAQRRFHRGDQRSIPVDAEDQSPGVAPVFRTDGEPDVLNLTGSVEVGQDDGLAGLDPVGVGVRFRVE